MTTQSATMAACIGRNGARPGLREVQTSFSGRTQDAPDVSFKVGTPRRYANVEAVQFVLLSTRRANHLRVVLESDAWPFRSTMSSLASNTMRDTLLVFMFDTRGPLTGSCSVDHRTTQDVPVHTQWCFAPNSEHEAAVLYDTPSVVQHTAPTGHEPDATKQHEPLGGGLHYTTRGGACS
jgi:hypothetical protein